MRELAKRIFYGILPLLDLAVAIFVFPSGLIMHFIRRAGVQRMPLSKKALLACGIFPIRNHYYEPKFDYSDSDNSLRIERELPGLNWNIQGQLELLDTFRYSDELKVLFENKDDGLRFRLKNYSFSSGDAEFWYQLIRSQKPKRIIEIGSGHSTLLASEAVEKNVEDEAGYECQHICVEPYEMPWLEQLGITIVRNKVEEMETAFFSGLGENDILFIDSSHMIRPNGDVLFEYLQLLPVLKSGVIVHVHDIFSPRNYPDLWLKDEVRFWNEQYLLEAFLTENPNWEIIGAVNYLQHNHHEALKAVAPSLIERHEPASFYIRRR